jgi:hypothetical protein
LRFLEWLFETQRHRGTERGRGGKRRKEEDG